MNRKLSAREDWKPQPQRHFFNLSNQALRACFSSYIAYFSLQTSLIPELEWVSKPKGWSINISLVSCLFRKALLTFNCLICHPLERARVKATNGHMFDDRRKCFRELKIVILWNTFATSLALNWEIVPSASS